MAVVLAVNVGKPQDVSWQGKTVHTGIWKSPVSGPAMVRHLNIDGDGQGDTAGHGGEQRAVFVYQIDSYRYWQQHLGRDDFGYGQFGENFTVDGLADDEVCIGDRYRIGEAEFEVTQPRVTCYRVGMRMGEPRMPALLVSHHRPGFYMRVITEGHVAAGDEIVKTRSGPGGLTVSATDALLYLPDRDRDLLSVAVGIPALSPGWRGSFEDLLKTGTVASRPAWAGFRSLRVTDVVAESATVSSFHLADPDGTALPAGRPGQYLTLRLPDAVRSYSLSDASDAGRYRISVKHEPHGQASGYLTTQLRAGTVIEVAAPRGEFLLEDGTDPVLLISAGIGLTPVLAMLHELAALASTREIWWIHAARSPQEHPLASEAHALVAGLATGHEHVFYSTTGRLTEAALTALALPTHGSAYVCGPASFMADMQRALTTIGLDPTCIHTELFAARPPINPGLTQRPVTAPHPPTGPPGTGPQVTFARSGLITRFPASLASVLELADACDVPSRWSCRTGVCHTCETPILAGSVSYSPEPLEPPADGSVLLCCARPDTDLVLDM